jgi:hypothetical protein
MYDDRQFNIFKLRGSERRHWLRQFIADLFVNRARNTDTPGRRQWFDPRCYVHPVSVNVSVAHHHVAHVNADPDPELPLGWAGLIPLVESVLDFHRCLNGSKSAGEFEQKSVARGFHLPPAMARQ